MYSKMREPVAATNRTLSMKSSRASKKTVQKLLALRGSRSLLPNALYLWGKSPPLSPFEVSTLSLLLMPSTPTQTKRTPVKTPLKSQKRANWIRCNTYCLGFWRPQCLRRTFVPCMHSPFQSVPVLLYGKDGWAGFKLTYWSRTNLRPSRRRSVTFLLWATYSCPDMFLKFNNYN